MKLYTNVTNNHSYLHLLIITQSLLIITQCKNPAVFTFAVFTFVK